MKSLSRTLLAAVLVLSVCGPFAHALAGSDGYTFLFTGALGKLDAFFDNSADLLISAKKGQVISVCSQIIRAADAFTLLNDLGKIQDSGIKIDPALRNPRLYEAESEMSGLASTCLFDEHPEKLIGDDHALTYTIQSVQKHYKMATSPKP